MTEDHNDMLSDIDQELGDAAREQNIVQTLASTGGAILWLGCVLDAAADRIVEAIESTRVDLEPIKIAPDSSTTPPSFTETVSEGYSPDAISDNK